MRQVLTIALFVGLCSSAAGDVLPPGHKGIGSETYILGLDKFPGYTFFLYPTTMVGGSAAVTPGRPLPSSYKLAPTRLYAVKGSSIPAKPDDGLPRSTERFAGGGATVPTTDPTATIRNYYRITAIDGGSIKVEFVKQERFDRAGKPLPAPKPVGDALLLGLSSLGLAGLALTRRRRR